MFHMYRIHLLFYCLHVYKYMYIYIIYLVSNSHDFVPILARARDNVQRFAAMSRNQSWRAKNIARATSLAVAYGD